MKYTANTKHVMPHKWLSRKVSDLKTTHENGTKTTKVTASWITFSSISGNGPPSPS
jgi:hypothetical protein